MDQDPMSADDLVGKTKIPLAHVCILDKDDDTEQDFDMYYEKDEDKRINAGTIKLRSSFKTEN